MDIKKSREELRKGKTIYDMPLKVAYYGRVSTDKDDQLNSLENQQHYFEDMIKENKNWIFTRRYIDEGISGTAVKNRDSFLKMIEDATSGKIDLILTKEISRFSRNTVDSIKYTEYLLKHGVIVYFLSDNLNTIQEDAEFRLTIMSSMAQDEVRKLSYLENINSLVSVSEDCLIYVWSLDEISFNPSSENVEPYLHLRGHTGPLFCLEHGRDNLIYTGGSEGLIQIFNILPESEITPYGSSDEVFNLSIGYFQNNNENNEIYWELKHHPKENILISLCFFVTPLELIFGEIFFGV